MAIFSSAGSPAATSSPRQRNSDGARLFDSPGRPLDAPHRPAALLRIPPHVGPVISPVQPQPARSRSVVLRTISAFDPDELCDIIPGGHIEHCLLETGPFEARAVHVETGRYCLDYLRYSRGIALKGELRPGAAVVVAFALRMPRDMVAFGIPQQSFALVHFDVTTPLELRLPADGEWVLLTVPTPVFEGAILQRMRGDRRGSYAQQLPLRVPGPYRRRLSQRLRDLIIHAAELPSGESQPTDVRALEDGIFDAFIEAFLSSSAPGLKDYTALIRRRALVSRAEEYMYAHIDDTVRMKTLCREVGASARALEYAFKGIYGLGAMDTLRTLRLNEVRKKLLRSSAQDVNITTAAMDWGFWHLGEFSGAYKRLFGELPSETRRQCLPYFPLRRASAAAAR